MIRLLDSYCAKPTGSLFLFIVGSLTQRKQGKALRGPFRYLADWSLLNNKRCAGLLLNFGGSYLSSNVLWQTSANLVVNSVEDGFVVKTAGDNATYVSWCVPEVLSSFCEVSLTFTSNDGFTLLARSQDGVRHTPTVCVTTFSETWN